MSLFSSNKSSAPPLNAAQPAPTPSSSLVPAVGLTLDDVKSAVPAHLRSVVNQQIVDNLNNISADPVIAEDIRNNFVSYAVILKEGKFKLEEYLNAVAYVSYKVMGYTNEDAYARTFPQRMNTLISQGRSKKDISSYVSAYNKGKLVNLVLERTLVPTWVLNQDIAQRAINHLATLMVSATSEKVQAEAAIGLLNHLQKPKEGNFQINIGETENAGMKELRDLLGEMAENQRSAIAEGRMKTIDVAAQQIRKDE